MKKDIPEREFVELERFAKEALCAANHPDDVHQFGPFACPHCGLVPLAGMLGQCIPLLTRLSIFLDSDALNGAPPLPHY